MTILFEARNNANQGLRQDLVVGYQDGQKGGRIRGRTARAGYRILPRIGENFVLPLLARVATVLWGGESGLMQANKMVTPM